MDFSGVILKIYGYMRFSLLKVYIIAPKILFEEFYEYCSLR